MSIASPYPTLHTPEQTLFDYIFDSLEPDELTQPAMTDSATGQTITFGELKESINALAGAIAARGIRPHHVVALHCPNSIAFAMCFHAIIRAGATVTTINALATPKDIATQLRDCDAEMIFSTAALGSAGFEAARECGLKDEAIIAIEDPEKGVRALIGQGHTPPAVTIDPVTHLAALPYSSGTTGKPKGVRLSHRNLVANLVQCKFLFEKINVTSKSVVLHVLPYFHIYGMNSLLNLGLISRTHSITMPKFDLVQFLELHQKFSVEFTFIAPPIAVALAKHPIVDSYDLSSVHGMLSGASSLDADLAAAVSRRLGCRVMQGYGMTETSPVTHLNVDPECPQGSIGRAVPNTEFKVVDISSDQMDEITPPACNDSDQSTECRSRDGELWVRGPQIMVGYLNNAEADAKTLTPEGWLRTGDIVHLDSLGNVYVVDRMKELIKYKGYQVAPAELEALLLTHDDVADCAVVAYSRPDDGEEVPRAFIVAREGSRVDSDALMEWVAERVAPYKKIRMVSAIEAIPKSVTGKILRKDLRNVPA